MRLASFIPTNSEYQQKVCTASWGCSVQTKLYIYIKHVKTVKIIFNILVRELQIIPAYGAG